MSAPLITIERARELVLAHTRPLGHERVDVQDALDRVLAEDVHAVGDVPPFACSAMDGFAIKDGSAGRTLKIVGESRAGTPSDHTLHDGEAIRISTGAAVPEGATAVIRQEDADADGQTVTINEAVVAGGHIRHPGEDMRAGRTVLSAGSVLHAAELGAAVAAGLGELVVSRRPTAQVLSTGDELRPPGEPLGPGEI